MKTIITSLLIAMLAFTGCSSTWKGAKRDTKENWKETKKATSKAWEATKEGANEAYDSAKKAVTSDDEKK